MQLPPPQQTFSEVRSSLIPKLVLLNSTANGILISRLISTPISHIIHSSKSTTKAHKLVNIRIVDKNTSNLKHQGNLTNEYKGGDSSTQTIPGDNGYEMQTSMAVRCAEDPVERFQHFRGRQSHEEAKRIASTVS